MSNREKITEVSWWKFAICVVIFAFIAFAIQYFLKNLKITLLVIVPLVGMLLGIVINSMNKNLGDKQNRRRRIYMSLAISILAMFVIWSLHKRLDTLTILTIAFGIIAFLLIFTSRFKLKANVRHTNSDSSIKLSTL